jgi:hypothetical protein
LQKANQKSILQIVWQNRITCEKKPSVAMYWLKKLFENADTTSRNIDATAWTGRFFDRPVSIVVVRGLASSLNRPIGMSLYFHKSFATNISAHLFGNSCSAQV